MIWQRALKNPVLIIGIVLFGIAMSSPKTKEYLAKQKRRFKPTSCDVLKRRIDHKKDAKWTLSCPGEDGSQGLQMDVEYSGESDEMRVIRRNMYRQIANNFVAFSHIANPESLVYLKKFKMIIHHDKIDITAATDGQAIVEFANLTGTKAIAAHLKLTVKVKEFFK